MFSKLHSYLSEISYNRYDFVNGILIGYAVSAETFYPYVAIVVLLGISFIKPKEH